MNLRKYCLAWIWGCALVAMPAMGEEEPTIPAWMYRTASDAVIHGSVSDDVVQSFLRNADHDDPRRAALVRRIEEGMKHPPVRAGVNSSP